VTFVRVLALMVTLLSVSTLANSQTVKVDQGNRTIEISAEGQFQTLADRVTITVGYRNYGPTHDQAFADNASVAARILKSWKDAGIAEKTISTDELISRAVPESSSRDWAEADRKQKQYQVFQSWRISEKPETAERLLDLAVDAGANEVGTPLWALSNSEAAELQAYSSALLKAHDIANQLAKSFGGTVGALLYASNELRPSGGEAGGVAGGVFFGEITPKTRPDTKLLPQKIEKTAYVRAIFALQ